MDAGTRAKLRDELRTAFLHVLTNQIFTHKEIKEILKDVNNQVTGKDPRGIIRRANRRN